MSGKYKSKNIIVEYWYWSIIKQVDTINKIRETRFYYLNSRYYDPSCYRFLNADSACSGSILILQCYNYLVKASNFKNGRKILSVYNVYES